MGLLLLNVVTYSAKSTLVPLPISAGKVITQGALVVAFVLAVSINRKVLLRPNLFLVLMTVLCITTLMMSVRGYYGHGSLFRALRLAGMVGVLWMLTPWWGSDDLLLLRYLRRGLFVVLAVVVLGAAMFPTAAFGQAGGNRLGGTIWPVPPTQVAAYAAVLAGTTVILWFAGLVRSRGVAVVTLACLVIIVLTHTRTALVGFLAGVLVASLSLFLTRRRVRRAIGVAVVGGGLIALSFAPFLSSWFLRGENHQQFASFTGRASVWTQLLQAPRTEMNTLFGYGMNNASFAGLPIDSSWYATYLSQGIVGDVIIGGLLLVVALAALYSPRGPRKAIALFLVVYCLVASFTETGLGDATPYLLYLAVAMSVLVTPAARTGSGAPPVELPVV